ncbi:MAG: acyltransferase [Bdellovibrionales bacterium]|nr:acyltransferase [Bdellovibrionales bacterium]
MIRNILTRINFGIERRNPAIDFLRGLSIFVVVLLHFGMYYTSEVPGVPRVFSFAYWGYFARNGYLGVSAFFVISGYLITSRSLARFQDLSLIKFDDFYSSRFARIAPPLLLLVGVNLLLYYLDEPGFQIQNLDKFAAWEIFVGAVTMRLNLYWSPSVTGLGLGVLWSLSIEEAFYVGFPILAKITRKLAVLVASLIGLVVYALVHRYQTSYPETFFGYFSCFDMLAFGSLAAIFQNRFPKFKTKMQKPWLNIFALICMIIFYISHHDREWEVWGSSVFGPMVVLFILSAAPQGDSKMYTGWFSRLMRVMGLYCYEIYLLHIVVIQLTTHYVFPELNSTDFFKGAVDIFFFLVWGITLVISILIAEYFSEPARQFCLRMYRRLHAKYLTTETDFQVLRE